MQMNQSTTKTLNPKENKNKESEELSELLSKNEIKMSIDKKSIDNNTGNDLLKKKNNNLKSLRMIPNFLLLKCNKKTIVDFPHVSNVITDKLNISGTNNHDVLQQYDINKCHG